MSAAQVLTMPDQSAASLSNSSSHSAPQSPIPPSPTQQSISSLKATSNDIISSNTNGQKKSLSEGKSTATPVITNIHAAHRLQNMIDNNEDWGRYSRMQNNNNNMPDENPLTTATATMLNLNGADEHSHPMGLIYDYYRMPQMDKGKNNDIWQTHDSAMEQVSTIKMAGTNGQPIGSQRNQQLYKGNNQDSSIRHSPDHSTASMRSHHSSPSSSDQSLTEHHSPHSTSPMNHAVVSSSTFSHSVKQEADGSIMLKQEQHELPPIHPAFGVAYANYGQAVPYVTSLADTQTVLLQAANGEFYRAPMAATAGTMMDYSYGFPGRGHFQDPTDQMLMERYRQASGFQQTLHGHHPVDLPSPDSGLGDQMNSRDHQANQMYEYNTSDLHNACVSASIMSPTTSTSDSPRLTPTPSNRRNSSVERTPVEKLGSANPVVNIPKVFSNVGFRYFLESPISTSHKRDEDRITYINKGQFYPITLEYIPDPDKPLKSQTVKSTIMLVFREEKTPDEEIKAWQFWHSRQHSIKQRIFDADTKNSINLMGCIEETSHNSISVYWNPHEGPAKVNIAVQCLSTDFSNQKGVKGLPLHIQIDTHEDHRGQGKPIHRGYCQIKVFCDKGAERKTRDEERRAAKRKMAAAGRKKLDDMYHPALERSEFYSMADLNKPPILFTPAEDLDRLPPMELSAFYSSASNDASKLSNEQEPCVVDNVLPPAKRLKIVPALAQRVMIYVRKESDDVYTALHLVPPTIKGLAQAVYLKFGTAPEKISRVLKKNLKGDTVEMDDDMLAFYSNEDTFIISILESESSDLFTLYLTELPATEHRLSEHSMLEQQSQ